jgi:RNA polymerase sigma-70 factor (ECF subfamily)
MGNQQVAGVRWAFGGGVMARVGAAATTSAPLRTAEPAVVSDAERSRLVRLVERMAAKDEAALAEFYDATAGKAYAFALRITRDAPLAEEVVADAFHQAWRDAGRYDPNRSGALTWLLMICRSRGLDALRARDPALVHDAPETLVDEVLLPSAEGPLDILQALQSRSAVHAAVAMLSAAQRQMVALAFFRGLSHQEIAEHTRTPLGTVKSQIRRALDTLRRHLDAVAQ